MLIQENLIIVVERNIEQKDRKVKASEFLVANHNHKITELQFIAFCNNYNQSDDAEKSYNIMTSLLPR